MNNFSVKFQEEIQEGENSTKLVNMAIKRKIKENHLCKLFLKTHMDTLKVLGKMSPI